MYKIETAGQVVVVADVFQTLIQTGHKGMLKQRNGFGFCCSKIIAWVIHCCNSIAISFKAHNLALKFTTLEKTVKYEQITNISFTS